MKITVFNKKGGVGKTPISISLAKDLNLTYYTNEKNPLKNIEVNYIDTENLNPQQMIAENCIFDFGGFASNIAPFIRVSNLVIIPTLRTYLSLVHAFTTIKTIKQYNKNICIVLTRVISEEFDVAKIKTHFEYPIFALNESKIFDTVIEEGKGITELSKELFFYKGKKIITQYEKLLDGVTLLAQNK